jgi:hypothetical protein
VIKAGRLFDSEKASSSSTSRSWCGKNIRQVGAAVTAPADARVVDLSAYTVCPG